MPIAYPPIKAGSGGIVAEILDSVPESGVSAIGINSSSKMVLFDALTATETEAAIAASVGSIEVGVTDYLSPPTGTVEINNGTPGTTRDLRVRTVENPAGVLTLGKSSSSVFIGDNTLGVGFEFGLKEKHTGGITEFGAVNQSQSCFFFAASNAGTGPLSGNALAAGVGITTPYGPTLYVGAYRTVHSMRYEDGHIFTCQNVQALRLNSAGAASFSFPLSLGVYTFATVPSASTNTGATIRISDRAQRQAYSDGTNWRFTADDVIIS